MKKKGASLGLADTLWHFFASVRLTVVLLLTLAATSMLGTLIPQNAQPAAYIGKYGELFYRIFSVLSLTDMYHSGWFRFFMLMLTVNIVVCSLDRISATLKIVFVKEPVFQIDRFRRLKTASRFTSSMPPSELIDQYRMRLGRWFGFRRVEETDQGHCIFAERGRWTRLGVYLVHLSVILLLLGGLIGSILGFDGFVNIPEGEAVHQIRVNRSTQPVSLDFGIRCDAFSVSFYPTGQPKEFRSTLTLLDGKRPILTRDVIVNRPLRYGGINIYQASYGQIPPDWHAMTMKGVALKVLDRHSKTSFSLRATVDHPVQLPENRGTFTLKALANSYIFKGRMDLGRTLVGQVTGADGVSQQVLIPLRFPSFDKMRQGRYVFTFEPRYYTGLEVTRDPGVWLVYVGFILLICGCVVTFFTSHQRLSVEIQKTAHGSQVVVSGTANKNRLGMENKVKRISDVLSALEIKNPDHQKKEVL
jgi:cytochrome c biogenesis protein